MSDTLRTVDEKLKTITGLVSTVSGLIALVEPLREKLISVFQGLDGVPLFAWYSVAGLLLIAGFFALYHGLKSHSYFLHPEVLLLQASNPRHLRGRAEAIEQLVRLCKEHPQIHLVGESGVGKTALIRAGLCSALHADPAWFPIYLDAYGQDWQNGPYSALKGALWSLWSEDDRMALGVTELPKSEDLAHILEAMYVILGRMPLIIFDQFDDYQNRHRTQFLPGRRRTWLPANQLAEANAFWKDIAYLIRQHAIHCLFVTRTDTASGLESIRFTEPQVYQLDGLSAEFILPFFSELTSKTDDDAPVVYAPDRGWERLKSRIVQDLSQDEAILPVQMKSALQSLASLSPLTVRAYERAGGLHGLAATHILWHVKHTARRSELEKSQILALLLGLVDAETLKTIPKSLSDIAALVAKNTSDINRVKSAIENVLDDLETKELLRRRLDPDTRQYVWFLDHDYLCHGVLAAERQENRWVVVAQEGYRAFQNSGGNIWKKWQTLLSPKQQLGLLTQRVRGSFTYENLRSYALWSLLRFVPYLAILILAGSGLWYWEGALGDSYTP